MRAFTRDGLCFDVRATGPPEGDPVVCLHGFPQDGSAYDEVARLLAVAGHYVVVPDQRAYSPGARPAGRTSYALPALVQDVVALLDAAQLPAAHVVGHDWGGAVAWALAARHSDRVRSLKRTDRGVGLVPLPARGRRLPGRQGPRPDRVRAGHQRPILQLPGDPAHG